MLSRRQVEIIAAVLVLIGLLILLIVLLKKPKTDVGDVAVTEPVVKEMPEVSPEDVPAPGVVSASTVARIFVERFGSYSSETNFANVDDVMILATPEYQAQLEVLVNDYRRSFDENDGYTGVSTIVIGTKTVSESEAATTFLVTTQREEAVGNPGNTTLRYQDVEVSLVKVGDDWLVNGLTWK